MSENNRIDQNGKANTQIDIQLRQKKVFDLVLLGMTDKQISETMEIELRMVKRDLQHIRKGTNELINRWSSESQNEIVAATIATFKRITEQAWKIHRGKAKPGVRLNALKLVMDNEEKQLAILQRAGIIDRAPDEISIIENNDGLSIAERKAAALAIIKERNKKEDNDDKSGD